MDLNTLFTRLGLGKNCAPIYKILYSSKLPLHIAQISKSTSIYRPEVYRNLTSLLNNGFVTKVTIGKRFYYEAENPQKVLKAFQLTETKAEESIKNITKNKEKHLPSNIIYLKGASGIRAAFDDVIERTPKKEMFYRYTSERNLEAVNKYLSPTYRAHRDNKKLERRVISNPISGKAKRSRLERFIKFIPPENDLFDQNIIQLIYSDSVCFINLNTEEVSIIRDKNLAKFQSVIFNQLYKKL